MSAALRAKLRTGPGPEQGPRRRRRRWGRRIVAGLVGTALALVGAELVVRAVWPLPLNAIARGTVRLSEDPRVLYELDPSHAEHNSLGLRGPEVAVQPAPGVRRVLVLGDSIAYGMGVATNETLAARLEERLGDSVEVLNAGVPGWSILQEAAWFEARGARLEPDGVLLVVCLNDWTAYTVEFDQLVATERSGGRSFFSFFYDPRGSALRRLLLRSHVVRRVQMALARRGWTGAEAYERETTREGVPLVETTSVKSHFEDRPFFETSFRRLAGTVDGALAVLLVPIGRAGYDETHAQRRAELERLCGDVGASFFDFEDLARAERPDVEPWWTGLYHADDAVHPGEQGFRVMAAALEPELRALVGD